MPQDAKPNFRSDPDPNAPDSAYLGKHDDFYDGAAITDRYDYVKIPPDDPWPRFKVVHGPSVSWQTEEQDAVSRRWKEEYFRYLGVFLGACQLFATELGYHHGCRRNACRRLGRCASRRREDDWSWFPGPMLPPCCTTLARVYEIRPLAGELMDQLVENASKKAGGRKGPE